MRQTLYGVLALFMFGALLAPAPTTAGPLGRHEVVGVEDNDLLKMRAGPGVGYNVIVGLPNGSVLRVESCTQTGGTRWCSVSLERARGLKGYVSWAYLRKI